MQIRKLKFHEMKDPQSTSDETKIQTSCLFVESACFLLVLPPLYIRGKNQGDLAWRREAPRIPCGVIFFRHCALIVWLLWSWESTSLMVSQTSEHSAVVETTKTQTEAWPKGTAFSGHLNWLVLSEAVLHREAGSSCHSAVQAQAEWAPSKCYRRKTD